MKTGEQFSVPFVFLALVSLMGEITSGGGRILCPLHKEQD